MVITEPAVASARLLGLGSKLYPSNIPRVLNKDLTRFMPSLSRVRQKKGSAFSLYFHKLMKHTLSVRFKLTVCVVS